jgi:hypothetical protein
MTVNTIAPEPPRALPTLADIQRRLELLAGRAQYQPEEDTHPDPAPPRKAPADGDQWHRADCRERPRRVRARDPEGRRAASADVAPHSLNERGWKHLTVSFSTSGDVPAQGADLVAVLADDSDRSSVLRGENSGQMLAHVSVARSISRVARVQAAGERTVQIQIPSSFPASQRHHLILFAQTRVNGRVLGADTKPL